MHVIVSFGEYLTRYESVKSPHLQHFLRIVFTGRANTGLSPARKWCGYISSYLPSEKQKA